MARVFGCDKINPSAYAPAFHAPLLVLCQCDAPFGILRSTYLQAKSSYLRISERCHKRLHCLHQILRSSSSSISSSNDCSPRLSLNLSHRIATMDDPFARKNLKFSRLPQAEDCETLLSDPQDLERHTKLPRWITHRYSIAMLSALSFFITALIGAWIGSRYISNPNSFCTQYVSQYCKYP